MNLFRLNLERIKHHKKHKEQLAKKTWYFFKWEIITIMGVMFFTSLLNQIPIWDRHAGAGLINEYPLRNNIIYSSVVIIFTIGAAIFIGVFTEMGKYIGRYGSAVFVLVPAFVWLFSERGEKGVGMTRILELSKATDTIIFWVTVGICLFFVLMTLLHELVILLSKDPSLRERLEFRYNYFNRLILLCVNILMIFLMSYAMINYALFALHLGDVTPAEKQALIDKGVPENEIYAFNFSNDKITMFHSAITVGFSLIMILIGLVSTFSSSKTVVVIAEQATEGELTEEEAEEELEIESELVNNGEDGEGHAKDAKQERLLRQLEKLAGHKVITSEEEEEEE